MKKIAFFVFKDDPNCFIHVLLNTLDLHEKDYEVKIVFEGLATKLIGELEKENHPLHNLYAKVKAGNFIDGVCKACSAKMGTLHIAEKEGYTILAEMHGHPSWHII